MNKATTVLAPPGAGYLRGEARERAEPLEMLADEYLLEGRERAPAHRHPADPRPDAARRGIPPGRSARTRRAAGNAGR